MTKINKGYNSKIVSLITVSIFLLSNAVYGIDLSNNKTCLRVPIGNYDSINKLLEGQKKIVICANRFCDKYPEFNAQKNKLIDFITSVTPEKFGTAFVNNPKEVAHALETIFFYWDKFQVFITSVTPEKFGTAFVNNPNEVAYALRTIFRNWAQDKLETFVSSVTPEKFGTAFANNPRKVTHALEIIFFYWDKFHVFIASATPEKFGTAFANSPREVVSALEWIFINWAEYISLSNTYKDGLAILDSYAKSNDLEEQIANISVIKSFELLKLIQNLSNNGRKGLLAELLNKEGPKSLFLILKFFNEFTPQFGDDQKPLFLNYYLGLSKIELPDPKIFSFRYGRNYFHVEFKNGKKEYVITKVFDSPRSAKKEYDGLKLLEKFGILFNPLINQSSVTYMTRDPGIFIMPTEPMLFASKVEAKKILSDLFTKSINQIYLLASNGYFHTSLTYLSHGMTDTGRINKWIAYRGGYIENVQAGLGHVNFRPGIGLVDAEHIDNSMALQEYDQRILQIDLAGSVFEISLGIIYAGIRNGLSVSDIMGIFEGVKIKKSISSEEIRLFEGGDPKIMWLIRNVYSDKVDHQRDTEGLLVWLENKLPPAAFVLLRNLIIPGNGNLLRSSDTSL